MFHLLHGVAPKEHTGRGHDRQTHNDDDDDDDDDEVQHFLISGHTQPKTGVLNSSSVDQYSSMHSFLISLISNVAPRNFNISSLVQEPTCEPDISFFTNSSALFLFHCSAYRLVSITKQFNKSSSMNKRKKSTNSKSVVSTWMPAFP